MAWNLTLNFCIYQLRLMISNLDPVINDGKNTEHELDDHVLFLMSYVWVKYVPYKSPLKSIQRTSSKPEIV